MSIYELFNAHMEDIARKALKQGAAFSHFLTPSQQAEVQRDFTRRRDVTLIFEGGFPNAERRIAVFLNPDWGKYRRETVIAAIRLSYRRQDTLGHRDILGAIMGMGVKRDIIGDIETGNPAYFVCTADMVRLFAEGMTQAGKVGLTATPVPLETLPQRSIELEELHDTVSSLRLDAVVSAGFNLSRSGAAELIAAGAVQLNHMECLNTSGILSPGDVISLRGKGKIKLLEAGGLSRKGRIRITMGRYV